MNRTTTVLAWLATALSAIASAAGLFTQTYRDVPAMVDQARGTDLATLLVAVPLLVGALWRSRRPSPRAGMVVAGGLGYLVYTYAIYAFQVIVNALTPVHIAIVGLAAWALAIGMPDLLRGAAAVAARRLPRRTTAGFLMLIVTLFAGLWLSQIGQAIATGSLPAAVAELHVPTSAVYTLDLAFVLPVFVVAAVLLVRGSVLAAGVALGSLVFSVLMALSILGLFAMQAARGTLSDPSLPIGFAAIAVVAALLAGLALSPWRGREPAAVPAAA
jgi:hypothetical protein